MSNKAYDVVIIGCGPGGQAAGRFAALNGARTLIVEKKRYIGFPEHDWVAIVYSWADFEKKVNLKIDTSCIISKAEEIVYFSPLGRRGKGLHLADSFFINRSLFERSMSIEAVRAGAEIMVNANVVGLVREKGQVKGVVVKSGPETMTIECPLVIGAHGSYSNVSRMVGLPLPSPVGGGALAYELVGVKSLQPSPLSYEIYMSILHGGLWAMGGLVSQHGEDRLVVGVTGRFGAKTTRASEALNEFKKHLEGINKYNFDKASPISLRVGGGGILWGAYEDGHKIVSDGVMLIGDASGKPTLCAPYGTPGIFNAMFAGRLAAEAAAAAIKAGDFSEGKLVKEYLGRIDEEAQPERPRILEARKLVVEQLGSLSPDKVEKSIVEIGEELVALRLYERGGVALSWCVKPVQDWLRKEAN